MLEIFFKNEMLPDILYVPLFKKKNCLFMRDRGVGRDTDTQAEREKQAPWRERSRLHGGNPDLGLDPTTAGSCPEPKAQLLRHSGIPYFFNF